MFFYGCTIQPNMNILLHHYTWLPKHQSDIFLIIRNFGISTRIYMFCGSEQCTIWVCNDKPFNCMLKGFNVIHMFFYVASRGFYLFPNLLLWKLCKLQPGLKERDPLYFVPYNNRIFPTKCNLLALNLKFSVEAEIFCLSVIVACCFMSFIFLYFVQYFFCFIISCSWYCNFYFIYGDSPQT